MKGCVDKKELSRRVAFSTHISRLGLRDGFRLLTSPQTPLFWVLPTDCAYVVTTELGPNVRPFAIHLTENPPQTHRYENARFKCVTCCDPVKSL